jgi:hypothetical protein
MLPWSWRHIEKTLSIFHSNIRSLRKKLCDIIDVIDVRDRPINLLGEGGWVCFFFRTTRELEHFIFVGIQHYVIWQKLWISLFFFPPPKSEYFFRKKNITPTPPFQVKWSFLYWRYLLYYWCYWRFLLYYWCYWRFLLYYWCYWRFLLYYWCYWRFLLYYWFYWKFWYTVFYWNTFKY